MNGFIAVTDDGWLRALGADRNGEVNFWQPRPTTVRQPEGTPWIFKIRGTRLVGGFGFFSYYAVMPLSIAWETFGAANGVRSYAEMIRRVEGLRRAENDDDRVGWSSYPTRR